MFVVTKHLRGYGIVYFNGLIKRAFFFFFLKSPFSNFMTFGNLELKQSTVVRIIIC